MQTPPSQFSDLHARLSQALLACRSNAAPKPVHVLRTTTRRLEGLLHKALEDHPRTKEFHKRAEKALRQLRKIRRLAGTVRDLDVHDKLLNKILETSTTPPPRESALQHNQQLLHHTLAERRVEAAHRLASGLAKREIPIERALERVAAVLEKLPPSTADPLATAQEWVRRSTLNLHELDARNLHDFRKQTKLARYVSEMQPPSKAARDFTRHLLAVQDAIGAWHDLNLLHEEAKAVCGKHAALTRFLADRAEESFRKALAKAGTIHRPPPKASARTTGARKRMSPQDPS